MQDNTKKFLLTPSDFQRVFAELLNESNSVKIVVAWARKGCPIDMLLNADIPTDTIIGTGFNATDPNVISDLLKLGHVYVDERGTNSIFHPKLYVFKIGSRYEAIVGSANLTDAAFTRNEEVAVQLRLNKQSAKPLIDYFERLKKDLKRVDHKWLGSYRLRYKPPRGGNWGKLIEIESALPSLAINQRKAEIGNLLTYSWNMYFKLLREQSWDDNKDPLANPKHSYLKTLEVVAPIMKKPFKDLEREDFHKLIGAKKKAGDDWGYFGSLTANMKGVKQLHKNKTLRRGITAILPKVANANNNEIALIAAGRLFNYMTRFSGVKHASATRFLALTRPDLFFSVNNRSIRRLAYLFGIQPAKLKTWAGYSEALRMVWKAKWYRSDRPASGLSLRAWKARVALLDLYAYDLE